MPMYTSTKRIKENNRNGPKLLNYCFMTENKKGSSVTNYQDWLRPILPYLAGTVPSALECFTTLFGMGRGRSTPLQ